MSAGYHHTCAIRPDGHVECWGKDDYASRTPAGLFDDIAAGDHFTCGIRIDGSLDCWGWATGGRLDHPENTRFLADAAGPAVEVVDCSTDPPDYDRRVTTDGFSFTGPVTVEPGGFVMFENTVQDMADVQTITSGEPGDPNAGSLFDIRLEIGASACLRFATPPGTYNYFSREHPEMTAQVIRQP